VVLSLLDDPLATDLESIGLNSLNHPNSTSVTRKRVDSALMDRGQLDKGTISLFAPANRTAGC
jgi:hypothetical protein